MEKKKIAVVTDSNSGITQQCAGELGITVLPMPFYINEQLFLEGITLTQEDFYERLAQDADISTSQPSPADVLETWEQLLADHDEIVHSPMSSGLSNSCQTAFVLAREYKGRVQVVDNQRISVTQRQSVLDAVELAKAGKNAVEIKEILEAEKRRQDHTRGGCARHCAESKTGPADSGREAGCLFKSQRKETGKACDGQSHGGGPEEPF